MASTDPAVSRPALLRDVWVAALVAALARLAGAALIHALGFSVVSDDDFARVVIAQKQAATPHLDPTGTSWLPMPFWIVGGAMRVLGSSLEVARGLSFAAGPLFGGALAAFAILIGLRRNRVIVASLAGAAMPWSMQLGVATVPEIPASIAAAIGCLAVASTRSGLRLVGGLALLLSTTSRYDAWVVAAAYALLCLLDARSARREERGPLLLAAAFALAGPVGFTLYQWLHFGDPFRYLRLVRSYRRALGQGPPLLARVLGYPLGVVEELREVLGALVVGAVARMGPARRDTDLDWRRPLGLSLLQLLVLIAGDIRDGAPTHHPERALLGPAVVVLFFAADSLGAALARFPRRRAWALGAVAGLAYLGWVGVRLQRSLRWYASAPRPREVAAGHALAAATPAGTRALIDSRDFPQGGIDYGYYAVLSSFGRPTDAVVDRDQDPRKPRRTSAFESEVALRGRLAETGARVALVFGAGRVSVARSVGGRVVAEERPGCDATPDACAQTWTVLVFPSGH